MKLTLIPQVAARLPSGRTALRKLSVCVVAAGLTLTAGCAGAGSLGSSENTFW